MNLSNLKTLARAYVPQAVVRAINKTTLELILNEATLDVALRTICLETDTTFNVVADQVEYDITTNVSDFLVISDGGLWWNDGSQWQELIPKTIKWLNENIPTWRNMSSGTPQYYAQYGDKLLIHPASDTALADGLKLYYGKKPQTMTASGHYPFGYTTEIARLAPLSEAILAYWEWKALKILGKKQESLAAKFQEYLEIIADKIRLINRVPNIAAHKKTKYQGRIIRG